MVSSTSTRNNLLNKAVNANACFAKPADDNEWKNVPESVEGGGMDGLSRSCMAKLNNMWR